MANKKKRLKEKMQQKEDADLTDKEVESINEFIIDYGGFVGP